eukprot:3940457-Rhodomonas_salina.5
MLLPGAQEHRAEGTLSCYAHAVRCAVLTSTCCYGRCTYDATRVVCGTGTGRGYAATMRARYALLRWARLLPLLRDVQYSDGLSCYPSTTRCAVLRWAMLLPLRYEACGPGIGYARILRAMVVPGVGLERVEGR